jgi:hypothetical protein
MGRAAVMYFSDVSPLSVTVRKGMVLSILISPDPPYAISYYLLVDVKL